MEPLMKMKDVCKLLRVDRCTLRKWLKSGGGPPYRKTPTGRYYFIEAEIRTWLDTLVG